MNVRYVLFYKPPCGVWYVHSHKLYESEDAAHDGARKFLPAGVSIAICPLAENMLIEEIIS